MLPYNERGQYSMLSIDMKDRVISIIDPTPLSEWVPIDKLSDYYCARIHSISMIFDRAMRKAYPTWNDDIYNWKITHPKSVPKTQQR